MKLVLHVAPARASMCRFRRHFADCRLSHKEKLGVAQNPYSLSLSLSLSLSAISSSRVDAQYIDLISPGPPPAPSDYLHLNFSFADSPPIIEMSLTTAVNQDVPIVSNSAYLRRNAIWIPAFARGGVATRVFTAPMISTGIFIINYAPELDAGLLAVDVAISASYPVNTGTNAREVTITGPNAYTRSFTVQNIPEPSSAVLALVGCLCVRRRLVNRRSATRHC